MHNKEGRFIDCVENGVGGNFDQVGDANLSVVDILWVNDRVSLLLSFVFGTAQSQNDGGW